MARNLRLAYDKAFYATPTSSLDFEEKSLLGSHSRGRLNLLAIFIVHIVPWVFFSLVLATMSMSLRYSKAWVAALLIMVATLLVIAIICKAMVIVKAKFNEDRREPNWWMFFALSMVIALFVGCVVGAAIYGEYTHPYEDWSNLNHYHDVDVAFMQGQQVMDAGRISFLNHSMLDLRKSMAYTNVDTYCVAPITSSGDKVLASYDFWVVGYECCSQDVGDFHCPNYNNREAHEGLRLLGADLQENFLKAVLQAESAYAISARRPVFVFWTTDATAFMNRFSADAFKYYYIAILTHFFWQAIAVVAACFAFSRMVISGAP